MKTLIVLLVLLGIGLPVQADNLSRKVKDDTYGFFFTRKRVQTRIPFLFQSNLIIVSVCVNGADSLRLIVDTGVGHTIITDRTVFEKRPLTLTRQIKLKGMGEGSTATASVSINNTLSIGCLRAEHHNLVILDNDLLKLSEYAGVSVHGLIGYELFADLVVTIDFQRRELILMKPQQYHYRPRKGGRYPLMILERKAYLDALSISDGNQFQPLRVVLDTGAGQALLLNRFQQGMTLPLPAKVVRVPLGSGFNGLITGSIGRFQKVNVGCYQLSNMLVSFPDSSDFGKKLAGMPDRQGNIGCELLRRFLVTINYPDRYIVFKPIKRLMREGFEHDMSGLELRAKGAELHNFFIDKVSRSSPAEQAGLQPGDELLVVDNKPVISLSISDIYRILQAGEGKSIGLIVQRNRQLVTVRFTLKRLI
ncbi:PDZ domain-containing protein [Spirosoma sp. HMF4905]|uniref:PDZ domain-containing protein n=1 Tax=Spirosoma arboris TaxID=2682092 RepID=A0A7K1SLJ5_9BACT|nr:aspartyl protease family protein [Spirosoma arboris]MVM34553.1 PDZ domain-containing protein [Spirosoma arboris]